MGSEWDTSSRHHRYSPGMSRRTRKPMKLLEIKTVEDVVDQHHPQQRLVTSTSTTPNGSVSAAGYHLQKYSSKGVVDDDHKYEENPTNDHQLAREVEGDLKDGQEEQAVPSDHHQLAKLVVFNGNEESSSTKLGDHLHSNRGGTSLSHHFIEEEKNNLNQLMVIKQEGGAEGIKLGKMMKRYMKVLSNMVTKRDKNPRLGWSKKKPLAFFS